MSQYTIPWTPLQKAMVDTQNIVFSCSGPKAIPGMTVYPIKEVCTLLSHEDKDWPLANYNFESKGWLIMPGTEYTDPVNNHNRVLWRSATHSVSTVTRFFKQLGWDITFTHWQSIGDRV